MEKIRTLVMEKLTDSGIEKVMFFEPEELIFYLESEAAREISAEQRVKGYKVKVQYEPESRSDKSAKRDTVAQILVSAMRRLKGKS